MMIKVSINNSIEELESDASVLKALETLGYESTAMLGIAVNQVFVPKDQWAKTYLQENDQIDILNPISGG
jgi:sulfur carrier protein